MTTDQVTAVFTVLATVGAVSAGAGARLAGAMARSLVLLAPVLDRHPKGTAAR